MPSTFKILALALLITFSFLAVSKVANAEFTHGTWDPLQWQIINTITDEVIVPVGKSLIPVVKDAGNFALEKSSEALEMIKNSFDNITKLTPSRVSH